jgi:nucleotide-binding universal stress UspA family protein
MFRTVLVHVDNRAGSAERTRFAVSLARQFEAGLIGLTAGLPRLPVEVYADGFGSIALGPEYTEFDRKHVEAEFGQTAAAFRQLTDGSGVETSWRAVFEAPSVAVIRAAAAADLVVLGTGDTSLIGDFVSPSAGDIVLHTGRPILLAPHGRDRIDVKNVVIAWKDTAEAQRAVADALPFMKRAGSVVVVQVKEDAAGAPDLADTQAFLKRHGIGAKTQIIQRGSASVADAVIDFARKSEADLIVSGAYGHTRMREWIFGGVTRGLLTRSPIPCLFSH